MMQSMEIESERVEVNQATKPIKEARNTHGFGDLWGYNRSGEMDVESLRQDTETLIDSSTNIREDHRTLEKLAEIWAFVHENLEREEWSTYTREDWLELEHEWIERARYTEPDLRDDLLIRQEHGNLTETQARVKYEKHQECEYVFCINVFNPKRKDQRFCCRNCKERQKEALKRFRWTGTYLPEHAYRDNREETDERNYMERETAYETESITDQIEPFERRREYGRKRDRLREESIGYTPIKPDC